ncbi:hypothetical protein HAX54_012666 [Datura stramonium]|uniref:Uncharacterized protein n=1 Tax=Datura stramonium TaxID=4076 RepID=A0ABS8TM12_DATST|nr:hypothetical protein [Datura stramonium]
MALNGIILGCKWEGPQRGPCRRDHMPLRGPRCKAVLPQRGPRREVQKEDINYRHLHDPKVLDVMKTKEPEGQHGLV